MMIGGRMNMSGHELSRVRGGQFGWQSQVNGDDGTGDGGAGDDNA